MIVFTVQYPLSNIDRTVKFICTREQVYRVAKISHPIELRPFVDSSYRPSLNGTVTNTSLGSSHLLNLTRSDVSRHCLTSTNVSIIEKHRHYSPSSSSYSSGSRRLDVPGVFGAGKITSSRKTITSHPFALRATYPLLLLHLNFETFGTLLSVSTVIRLSMISCLFAQNELTSSSPTTVTPNHHVFRVNLFSPLCWQQHQCHHRA